MCQYVCEYGIEVNYNYVCNYMYVCSYNAPMQYQQIHQVLACQGLTIPLHVLAIAILCTLSSRPYPYSCPCLSCILQSTVVQYGKMN